MKKLHFLSIILILAILSCSTKKRYKRSMLDEKGRPKWITEPMSFCKEQVDLCIVGEGAGKLTAESNAQKNFAQFFENKITAKTVTSTDAFNQRDGDAIISGEMTESINQEIEEVTEDLILKGVEFRERFDDDGRVYVLMALNKRKAAEGLRGEIRNYDDKMKALFERKKRAFVRKLMKNFEAREKLNSHYQVITGQRIPQRYSYDQIFSLKKNRLGKNYVVFVKVDNKSGETLKGLQTLIVKSLTSSDFLVTTKDASKAKIKVFGKLSSEKLFLNVDGFVKYKFTLELNSKNLKGQHIGAMTLENTQVARSFKQAYNNALIKMNQLLITEDRISDLELIE